MSTIDSGMLGKIPGRIGDASLFHTASVGAYGKRSDLVVLHRRAATSNLIFFPVRLLRCIITIFVLSVIAILCAGTHKPFILFLSFSLSPLCEHRKRKIQVVRAYLLRETSKQYNKI
jgi:hypothetical protein